MPQFLPASAYAQQFGVKSVVYGPPGSGKTPLINTAPNPVLMAVEPGLLSMRGSQVMTCLAPTVAAIEDFMKWLKESNEARSVGTVCIDSISQMAEIYVEDELKKNKDGRKAYGEMSRKVMGHLNYLYFSREKHVCLIAKEGHVEETGVNKRRPHFPGQDLNVKVPHLFDEILHCEKMQTPKGDLPALRTRATLDVVARDRSGKLDEYEPPNLSHIFNKIMT